MNYAGINDSAGKPRIWPLGRLAADTLLSLHSYDSQRYPYLLESSAVGRQASQVDMLLSFPGEGLSLHAHKGLVVPSELGDVASGMFLEGLDEWWRRYRIPHIPHSLPFHGGWFIYLSYELSAQVETCLQSSIKPAAKQLIAQAVRVPAGIIRNSSHGESWFVSEDDDEADSRFNQLSIDLAAVRDQFMSSTSIAVHLLQEEPSQSFMQAIEVAQAHITSGDIYQANLSRGWQAQVANNSATVLYRRLKVSNPGPFAGSARLSHDHSIISSSPERLIELRNGWVNTRPIAGTRPRNVDANLDQLLVEELRSHPKERAEHIMLLDLERNDLGRICQGGTVEVDEYMQIESYRHVHHIVSNVRGRLQAGITPGMAIAAVFPGGTITGCPKVRCMEIIAGLEPEARGAYTGSMGYLNRDGSMDLNILIRTLELQGSTLSFRAGAGIVADSIPERELEETRAKALGLLRAIQD